MIDRCAHNVYSSTPFCCIWSLVRQTFVGKSIFCANYCGVIRELLFNGCQRWDDSFHPRHASKWEKTSLHLKLTMLKMCSDNTLHIQSFPKSCQITVWPWNGKEILTDRAWWIDTSNLCPFSVITEKRNSVSVSLWCRRPYSCRNHVEWLTWYHFTSLICSMPISITATFLNEKNINRYTFYKFCVLEKVQCSTCSDIWLVQGQT